MEQDTNEQNPIISIIVLTYNKFGNIRQSIASILSQTYENYEVLICDDGSPNIDVDLIKACYHGSEKADHFRIMVREQHLGTVRNYNRAVLDARGDIIVPLSQDDRFYSVDTLAEISKVFQNKRVNLCIGFRVNAKTLEMLPSVDTIRILKETDRKKRWFRNACGNCLTGASLYLRRNYLISHGLFDGRYALLEDTPFAMKVMEEEEPVLVLDYPTIYYGTHGISKSPKQYPMEYIFDGIRMREENCRKSEVVLHSRLCREYLAYLLRIWRSRADGKRWARYKSVTIDLLVIWSKTVVFLTKRNATDVRFDILWRFEKAAMERQERRKRGRNQ